jgi:hypothetical protein
VRNPWDLYVSWYFSHFTARYPSFSEFILKWEEWWNTPSFCFRNQVGALLDNSGNIGVDFVGRYENLNNDFACVLDLVGLPRVKLKQFAPKRVAAKRRPPGPYARFYAPEMRDIVARIASPTIKAFDYTFE